jgi:hypothetical protein
MIKALIDGRKTQTRRIIKPQPASFTPNVIDIHAPFFDEEREEWGQIETIWSTPSFDSPRGEPMREEWRPLKLPARAGDRLWVRENFAIVPATAYRMSDGVQQTVDPDDWDMAAIYAAGWERSIPKWRPSIHMPRWASRLTLVVESVKVERLQDISEAAAVAEGCGLTGEQIAINEELRLRPPPVHGDCWHLNTAIGNFISTWCAIHGGIDAWDANPFVAAITFRAIKANIDSVEARNV